MFIDGRVTRSEGYQIGWACYGLSLGAAAVALFQGFPHNTSSWIPCVIAPAFAAAGAFLRHRLYLLDPEALREYRSKFDANLLSISFSEFGELDRIFDILRRTSSTSGAAPTEDLIASLLRDKMYEELKTKSTNGAVRLSCVVLLYGGSPPRAVLPLISKEVISRGDVLKMLLADLHASASLNDLFDSFSSCHRSHSQMRPTPGTSASSPLGFCEDSNILTLLKDLNQYVGPEGENTMRGPLGGPLKSLVQREFPWLRGHHGVTPSASECDGRGTDDVLFSAVRYYQLLLHPLIGMTKATLTELIESCDPHRVPTILPHGLFSGANLPHDRESIKSNNTVALLSALTARDVTSLDWRCRMLAREIVTAFESNPSGLSSGLWYLEAPNFSISETSGRIPTSCSSGGRLLTMLGFTVAASNLRSWDFADSDQDSPSPPSPLSNTGDAIDDLIVSFNDRDRVGGRVAQRRPPMDIKSSVSHYYAAMGSSGNALQNRRAHERGGLTLPLFTVAAVAPLFHSAFPVGANTPYYRRSDRANAPRPTPVDNIVLFCIYWEPILRAHGLQLIPGPLVVPVRQIMESFDVKVQAILNEFNSSNGLYAEVLEGATGTRGVGHPTIHLEPVNGPLVETQSNERIAQCKASITAILRASQRQFEDLTMGFTYNLNNAGNNDCSHATFSFKWNGQNIASAGCAQQ